MRSQLRGKEREIGGNKMISDRGKLLEPESGDLVQDRAFVGNRIRQNDVESGEAVGRDEEQRLAEIEDFAHLAAAQFGQVRKIERDKSFVRHDVAELQTR